MEAKGNSQDAKQDAKAADTAAGAPSSDEDLSMEEILQSIRRIIAEDDKDAKKPADASKAKSKGKDEDDVPGSDVFELTELLKDDGSVVNVKAEADKAPPPADVLNQIDEALITDKKPAEAAPVKPEPKAEPAKPAAPATSQSDIDAMFASPPAAPIAEPVTLPADSLLSASAASASIEALNKLKAADQYVPPAPVSAAPSFRDGTTMEDLVTEMLRPMMKAWLDNNLPQIVERIVEREIRKLTK